MRYRIQQKVITNYQTLVDDEAALAALKSGAAAAAQQPAADQTAPAGGTDITADPAAQATDGTVAQQKVEFSKKQNQNSEKTLNDGSIFLPEN